MGNAFMDSQFNYAPSQENILLWNWKINYKTLEAIYDIDDSYNKLLLRSNCLISWKAPSICSDSKRIAQINPEFMSLFFKQKKLS